MTYYKELSSTMPVELPLPSQEDLGFWSATRFTEFGDKQSIERT